MAKRLDFPESDAGVELFRYLWDGITLGSLQLRNSLGQQEAMKIAKSRTREEAKIQRKLIAISGPCTIEQAKRPQGARDLLFPGLRSVIFEVSELELIDKLLQAWPWGGGEQIQMANLYDALAQVMASEDVSP